MKLIPPCCPFSSQPNVSMFRGHCCRFVSLYMLKEFVPLSLSLFDQTDFNCAEFLFLMRPSEETLLDRIVSTIFLMNSSRSDCQHGRTSFTKSTNMSTVPSQVHVPLQLLRHNKISIPSLYILFPFIAIFPRLLSVCSSSSSGSLTAQTHSPANRVNIFCLRPRH